MIEVENYLYATSQLAQTTLRSVCGQAELDQLLAERDEVNQKIQTILDEQTDPWGIKVVSVEVKHIDLPQEMQRAMARQAEAERERRAKVISAEGEFQASARLAEAAGRYGGGADRDAAALPSDSARDRYGAHLDDRHSCPDRPADTAVGGRSTETAE